MYTGLDTGPVCGALHSLSQRSAAQHVTSCGFQDGNLVTHGATARSACSPSYCSKPTSERLYSNEDSASKLRNLLYLSQLTYEDALRRDAAGLEPNGRQPGNQEGVLTPSASEGMAEPK